MRLPGNMAFNEFEILLSVMDPKKIND